MPYISHREEYLLLFAVHSNFENKYLGQYWTNFPQIKQDLTSRVIDIILLASIKQSQINLNRVPARLCISTGVDVLQIFKKVTPVIVII